MQTLLKHLMALVISILITTPIYALNGSYSMMISGRIPWIAGSFFVSALWSVFLTLMIVAPVASISLYLIEHRFYLKWFFEPLVLLAVLVLYFCPVFLFWHPGWVVLPALAVSLYFPSLIYYGLQRAIGMREMLH